MAERFRLTAGRRKGVVMCELPHRSAVAAGFAGA